MDDGTRSPSVQGEILKGNVVPAVESQFGSVDDWPLTLISIMRAIDAAEIDSEVKDNDAASSQ